MLRGFLIKNRLVKIILIVSILILAVVITLSISVLNNKTFYEGVYIENTDVSGLNIIQAKELIDSVLEKKYKSKKINLHYGSRTWQIHPNDISLEFLTEKALKDAYNIGREGNLIRRLYKIIDLKSNCINIYPECRYNMSKLKGILYEIKKQIDIEAKDASVIVDNQNISFKKEVIGRVLDVEKNIKIVDEHIKNRRYKNIDLLIEQKMPKILYKDIKELNYFISSYSTVFNSQNHNRSHNIKLACERINNRIIMPKEIFSMDASLGPRTVENGYKEAPVIFKSELIRGIGGGVCQVTTTLYVAVLKARLAVIERTPHSLPLGYVEPGQDATIAENSIDFKFQNNTDYPVCIGAEARDNRVIISIISKKPEKDLVVKLKSEILEYYLPEETEYIIDNGIPDGKEIVVQKERKGYRVAVYREVYDTNGKLIEREKISEDAYKPVRGQIKVNEDYFQNQTNDQGSSAGFWYLPYPLY